jgi:hypothetical protein
MVLVGDSSDVPASIPPFCISEPRLWNICDFAIVVDVVFSLHSLQKFDHFRKTARSQLRGYVAEPFDELRVFFPMCQADIELVILGSIRLFCRYS